MSDSHCGIWTILGVEKMLVLTRSIGERLFIQDGEIKIQVLEVKGNQVRLGIEAPKHIAIHREEVFDRIKTEGSAQKNNLVAQQEEAA